MKIIGVNGSPRKNWNTHILLNKALEGAKSAGAQTELINLYDLDYKGCIGCLACKVKGGKSLGHCAVNDELKPVLDRIDKSDGLILGSPIYMMDVTAMMRAFLERLTYQYANFDNSEPLFTGKLKTSFIYTMNGPTGYFDELYKKYEMILGWNFEYTGTVESTETLQVEDYSKYHLAGFNEAERKERREKVFPDDCQKAY
ncbi:MAG: flavodoxin family protein, partial [Fibrobacter sp.]|nr:flavodoxin family protein [Fibrobacter sp.]